MVEHIFFFAPTKRYSPILKFSVSLLHNYPYVAASRYVLNSTLPLHLPPPNPLLTQKPAGSFSNVNQATSLLCLELTKDLSLQQRIKSKFCTVAWKAALLASASFSSFSVLCQFLLFSLNIPSLLSSWVFPSCCSSCSRPYLHKVSPSNIQSSIQM